MTTPSVKYLSGNVEICVPMEKIEVNEQYESMDINDDDPNRTEQLSSKDAVQEYLDDMEDAENYRDHYIEMCTRVDLKIRETVVPTETEKEKL
ncbi:hypothetical protein TNCV_1071331 [Trichonephila clavipes]|nr:hypothetical protein TNCV_1071331 [Trichonephila clavipes]